MPSEEKPAQGNTGGKKTKREKRIPLGAPLNLSDADLDAVANDVEALKSLSLEGWERWCRPGLEGLIVASEMDENEDGTEGGSL